jgi:hypothetical protein
MQASVLPGGTLMLMLHVVTQLTQCGKICLITQACAGRGRAYIRTEEWRWKLGWWQMVGLLHFLLQHHTTRWNEQNYQHHALGKTCLESEARWNRAADSAWESSGMEPKTDKQCCKVH